MGRCSVALPACTDWSCLPCYNHVGLRVLLHKLMSVWRGGAYLNVPLSLLLRKEVYVPWDIWYPGPGVTHTALLTALTHPEGLISN